MIPSVGAIDGTSIACPAKPSIARLAASATTAVVIGSGAATKVRKAKTRMIRAASTPMISLSPVLGLESCWPRYPPAETSIPAFSAGLGRVEDAVGLVVVEVSRGHLQGQVDVRGLTVLGDLVRALLGERAHHRLHVLVLRQRLDRVVDRLLVLSLGEGAVRLAGRSGRCRWPAPAGTCPAGRWPTANRSPGASRRRSPGGRRSWRARRGRWRSPPRPQRPTARAWLRSVPVAAAARSPAASSHVERADPCPLLNGKAFRAADREKLAGR